MAHPIRMLALVLALSVAGLAQAAKPAKKTAKPAAKTPPPAVKIDYKLSHAFPDTVEADLKKLVERFNATHPATPLKVVRVGEETGPTLLNILKRAQVAELVANKKSFRPLHAVMKEAGEKLDGSTISGNLRAGVVDDKGRWLGLPIAYSTPVLYYNKNAFRKAKLDPEKAPATWQEVQETAAALSAAGYRCPYTTSWPTWIHLDNLTALSNATLANPKGDLVFNGLAQVRHIAKLATWKTAGYFHLFGRANAADEQFRNGNCVMLTSDASAHTDFRDAQGVELGIAPLPYPEDVWGGAKNTIADGAALWIGGGRSAAEYKVAAKFVAFLLTSETQIALAGVYGYLPLTDAAAQGVAQDAARDRKLAFEVASGSMKGRGSALPLRVAEIYSVRLIVDEELEKVWNEGTPPKLALDNAVTRGNAVLRAKPWLRKATPF